MYPVPVRLSAVDCSLWGKSVSRWRRRAVTKWALAALTLGMVVRHFVSNWAALSTSLEAVALLLSRQFTVKRVCFFLTALSSSFRPGGWGLDQTLSFSGGTLNRLATDSHGKVE